MSNTKIRDPMEKTDDYVDSPPVRAGGETMIGKPFIDSNELKDKIKRMEEVQYD